MGILKALNSITNVARTSSPKIIKISEVSSGGFESQSSNSENDDECGGDGEGDGEPPSTRAEIYVEFYPPHKKIDRKSIIAEELYKAPIAILTGLLIGILLTKFT